MVADQRIEGFLCKYSIVLAYNVFKINRFTVTRKQNVGIATLRKN